MSMVKQQPSQVARQKRRPAEISVILFAHDPMRYKDLDFGGMTDMAGNEPDISNDYYDVARTIVPRMPEAKNVDDLRAIIVEEFADWFGDTINKNDSVYTAIAEEVWLSL